MKDCDHPKVWIKTNTRTGKSWCAKCGEELT